MNGEILLLQVESKKPQYFIIVFATSHELIIFKSICGHLFLSIFQNRTTKTLTEHLRLT